MRSINGEKGGVWYETCEKVDQCDADRLELEESVGLGLKDTYVFHLNTKQKIKWSSSNTRIATVTSKGKVTAVDYGDAVITATVSGKKYKCKLSVLEPCFCDSKYQWVESNRTMKVGETYRLRLAWATPKSYSSNRASIASVNRTREEYYRQERRTQKRMQELEAQLTDK